MEWGVGTAIIPRWRMLLLERRHWVCHRVHHRVRCQVRRWAHRQVRRRKMSILQVSVSSEGRFSTLKTKIQFKGESDWGARAIGE